MAKKAQGALGMRPPPPWARAHSGEPRAGLGAGAHVLGTGPAGAGGGGILRLRAQGQDSRKQKALLLRNAAPTLLWVLNPLPRDTAKIRGGSEWRGRG